MEKKNWFVANYKGELIGHDLDKYTAKILAAKMQEEEPSMEWEALFSD